MLMDLLLLDLDRELASLSLVVPFLDPVNRAQRSERLEKDFAWLKILALHGNTTVVVHVVLCTVLGLIGVGETRVKLGSFELEVSCVHVYLWRFWISGDENRW